MIDIIDILLYYEENSKEWFINFDRELTTIETEKDENYSSVFSIVRTLFHSYKNRGILVPDNIVTIIVQLFELIEYPTEHTEAELYQDFLDIEKTCIDTLLTNLDDIQTPKIYLIESLTITSLYIAILREKMYQIGEDFSFENALHEIEAHNIISKLADIVMYIIDNFDPIEESSDETAYEVMQGVKDKLISE